jgi:hypothetical protein
MGLYIKTLENLVPQSRNIIKRMDVYRELKNGARNEIYLTEEYSKNKLFVPVPHIVKEKLINQYAKKYGTKVFIETGTYLGIMINALKDSFDTLYSIELSEVLYKRALKLFKKYKKINIIYGDSGSVISIVIAGLNEPALFWLDGHYSGGVTEKADIETPIMKELECIFTHPIKNHLILIDDARLFIGKRDYPTLEVIRDFTAKHLKDFSFTVQDDILIIINNIFVA